MFIYIFEMHTVDIIQGAGTGFKLSILQTTQLGLFISLSQDLACFLDIEQFYQACRIHVLN